MDMEKQWYLTQNKMNLYVLSGHGGDSFAAFLNGVILQKIQRDSYHCSSHHGTNLSNQCAGKRTFATPKPNPNSPKPSFFQKKSFKSPKNSKNRVCLQWTLYQVVTNRPKSRFSAAKKVGFLIK